jgi:ribokinase
VNTTRNFQLVGLGTAVHAVVVRPATEIVVDGAVPGHIAVGRGGMICNTLAVAAGLGVPVGGIIANGADPAGVLIRTVVEEAGVVAAYVPTLQTPTTVTIAVNGTRSSVMGVEGGREADLEPGAVADAWGRLGARPAWVMLTLPALDSPAGIRFVELAREVGAAVAVTLSSAGHVSERAGRLERLLAGVDLVFGNTDEVAALRGAEVRASLLITTDGARGATISTGAEERVVPSAPAEVVDTTGAGDAFAGGVLATLDPAALEPLDLDAVVRAVQTGHRAAAVIIGMLGAEPGQVGRERLAGIPVDPA